jgi:hypothetical protein
MEGHPLLPLAIGLVATVLALVRITTWVAVGAWVTSREGEPVAVPLGLVVGAAITGCCYALGALAGRLGLALGLDAAIAVVACMSNWRLTVQQLRDVQNQAVDLCRAGPWTRWLSLVWLVLAWLTAVAPPRDADVLRYHLAHVRQIVLEGRWARIPDTAYALPFGWSLTYLPFEELHTAIAAQMLNLAVWVIVLLAVSRRVRARASLILRLLLLALACQAMVFKAATTAHADAYVMLLTTVVALLLTPSAVPLTRRSAALLGFAAWVGAQSRYQALAIGLAATATLLAAVGLGVVRPRALLAAAGGAVAAAALAAPFYLTNLRWFGNPLWPLLASSHPASYADRIALVMAQRTSAPLALGWLPRGLYHLAIDITVFPIPWMVGAAMVAGWWTRRTRLLAFFVTCYVLIWVLVEPSPYPRFIIYLVPLVPLLAADAVGRLASRRGARHRAVVGALGVGCGALAGFLLVYSAPAVRYAVTGDRERYDRATWFAPVFRWANTATPATARFLVVVKSGGTYALERPYRRADPEGSAEIDWLAVQDARALVDRLRAAGFQYLMYEDRDWSLYPGGAQMARVVHDAMAEGLLRPVETFELQLVTSRLFDRSAATTVRVLRVPEATEPPRSDPGTTH